MLTLDFTQFPVFETSRLLLRKHHPADAGALFAMRRNEDVMRFIDRPRPADVGEISSFIETFNEGFTKSENLAWVIALKDFPEEFIGSIGYWRMDLPNHRAEVGYMLHPTHWRKGIIDEALKAVEDFGFREMKLHTISANINPENAASRQLLIKHGYKKEAYFRENLYNNGSFLDSEVYGLLTPYK